MVILLVIANPAANPQMPNNTVVSIYPATVSCSELKNAEVVHAHPVRIKGRDVIRVILSFLVMF